MTIQAIQAPQPPATDAERQAAATRVLTAVTQARTDHKDGKLTREEYFQTVDNLGVEWRSLFREQSLLRTHIPEEAR